MKIFPAIDLSDGQVVRLRMGRFDERTVYADDPLPVAREYVRLGASRLHVVDLDGTRDGTARQTRAIRRLLEVPGLEVQVGGGIRGPADAETLLEAGARAIVIGSLAVREPDVTRRMLERFGAERVVVAVDCRIDGEGVPRVVSQGWTVEEADSVFDVIGRYKTSGLTHVLCTDVARDGMLAGPNVGLYRELARRFPRVGVQASGGVRDACDLEALAEAGASGVIIGRALYEGTLELSRALELEDGRC